MRLSFKHIAAVLCVALVLVGLAFVSGIFHPHIADVVATAWHGFLGDLSATGSGIALALPPLVTKNPKALKFRAQAEALEAELLDETKTYAPEEVEKRTKDIQALHKRAQAAAEFTPDDELSRQLANGGGEGGEGDDLLRRVNGGAGGDAPKHRTGKAQSDAIRKRAIEEFGSVGKMVMALTRSQGGSGLKLNERQEKIIDDLGTLTRTIVGTTSDPSGGEFLLPLQQEPSIFRVQNVQAGILPVARKYTVRGRTLRIPYYVQDQATGASGVVTFPMAGGIAEVSIIGEAVTKPEMQGSFAQRLITAYKYAAYTEFGDEVLDDDFTGELPTTVIDAVGDQVLNQMDDHMTYSGDGSSKPLGALNDANGSLLSFNRAGTGALATADIFGMYQRHTHGPNSYWSLSRYTMGALLALTLGSNTLVSWLPNLRDGIGQTPFLLGLPVRFNDFQPVLGSKADIALINPDFYAAGVRTQLTVDSSVHFRFRNDVTAYRFVARAGGLPLPTSTYAYRATGTTKAQPHSPFVTINGN